MHFGPRVLLPPLLNLSTFGNILDLQEGSPAGHGNKHSAVSATTGSLMRGLVKTLPDGVSQRHSVCLLLSLRPPHSVDKGQELFSVLHK